MFYGIMLLVAPNIRAPRTSVIGMLSSY